MTNTEFIEVTREIEKYYEKELTTEQMKIWFEELKILTKERYRQISREVYKKLKFMPKLADIIEINTTIPLQAKKDDGKHYECTKCNSTGIVIYKRVIDGYTYDYGARCDCQNGQRLSHQIPSINEVGIFP